MSWGDEEIYDGATEPLWYGERKVWSVTGFVLGVRSRVVDIPTLWIEGEISELRVPTASQRYSTVFFTLKDPHNGWMVSATMPKARFQALGLNIRDGDLVQCFGRADIYTRRGTFQIRVQSMEHAGRGLILQQLEALKARLESEGLFDQERKLALPVMPRRIGVITGAGAAAQGDFLRNIHDRFPPAKLVMIETLVQGDRAAAQIVAALRKLEKVDDVDVIVITRGGGAFEDFLPFSDERVCRAIAACPKPVVSAIGHQKDTPISDWVADMRVSTPTEAARTVVPDYAAIVDHLSRLQVALRRRSSEYVRLRSERTSMLGARLNDRSPARFVAERKLWIGVLAERGQALTRKVVATRAEQHEQSRDRMRRALTQKLDLKRTLLAGSIGQLRALSPRSIIERGYAIVHAKDGRILQDVQGIEVGEQVQMRLGRGTLHATVEAIEEVAP